MTKQTDKATARPWTTSNLVGTSKVDIFDENLDILVASNVLPENAALIVRAVHEYDALNAIAEVAKNYQSHCFLYGINDTRTLKVGTLLEDAISNLGTIWERNMK